MTYDESMRLARSAQTVDELRAVLLDIAERAINANSAAAVSSIAEIAATAAAKGESDDD